jgi:hypothetical protein
VFLQVYDDIQQELSLKTDALRKTKIKVKWNILMNNILCLKPFSVCFSLIFVEISFQPVIWLW